MALILGVIGLLLAGCARRSSPLGTVTVGSSTTPEQMVLGKLTVLMLQQAGYQVNDRTGLGEAADVRAALEAGDIDTCWEYTGETWTTFLGHDLPISDTHEAFVRVRDEDALQQITWLTTAPCQRRLGVVVRAQDAEQEKLSTLSALASYLANRNPNLQLCVPQELYSQVNGLVGLEHFYDLNFAQERILVMPMDEGYQAVLDGQCDCAVSYSTDCAANSEELVFLGDDRGLFAASSLAVAVRTPILDNYPQVEQPLATLATLLTQSTLTQLVVEVTEEGQTPENVARRFLKAQGLL